MRHARLLLALAIGVSGAFAFATCGGSAEIGTGGGTATAATTSSTSGTSGSGGSTTGTPTGGAGGGGAGCPVAYTNVSGECDVMLQDCPAGHSCIIEAGPNGSTTVCVASGGTAVHNEPCYDTTDCADGFFCQSTRCNAYCCPATDEPCLAWPCEAYADFGAGAYAYLCIVEGTCALFYDECPGDWECHILDPSVGTTVCDQPSASQSPEGGPCQYRNDCGESQHCDFSLPGDGICRHLCDLDDWQSREPGLGGCQANRTCVDVYLPAFPNVGICWPT